MTTRTFNELAKGDIVLYETSADLFVEATILEILPNDEVTLDLSINGHLTGRRLTNVKSEWCVKKTDGI